MNPNATMNTQIVTTKEGSIIVGALDAATHDAIRARLNRAAKRANVQTELVLCGSIHVERGSRLSQIIRAKREQRAKRWTIEGKPSPLMRLTQSRAMRFLKSLVPAAQQRRGWVAKCGASRYAKSRAFGHREVLAGPVNPLP